MIKPRMIKLRMISLNVGYNVMRNKIKGSEGSFVKLCQSRQEDCSQNSASLVSRYDLILLQEVSATQWPAFLDLVKQLGKQRGANYQALFSYYFGDWMMAVIFDENILGMGIQVTPSDFELYEKSSVQMTGSRGIIVVWFEKHNLIAINVHSPHGVQLKEMIETRIRESEHFLQKLMIDRSKIRRILMGGDFNDSHSAASDPGFSIDAYGQQLRIPVDPMSIPKTCCFDSNYRYAGDYILDSRKEKIDQSKGEYFGVPPGYRRDIDLYSDHDPIVLITHLDVTGLSSFPPTITAPKPFTLKGLVAKGRIQTSGSYVEIQFPQFDQDQLIQLARAYVKEKNLNWEVRKPHAWTDYNSMPHVTLHPSMKKYYNEEVEVKFGEFYHFAEGRSRWVVIGAELPPKFKCEYECHMSIGQQRVK